MARWLLPSLLMFLYAVQCGWFIRTQSLTYDEPVHIAEGLNAWRYGRFEQYNDHPPLARLWFSLPLLNPKWQVDVQKLPDSFHITRIAPDPEALAGRARAMNVLLGLLLAWLVWRAADKLFSRGAANFALALFAFSPSLIAHFSVATTDGAATLFIFATAWGLRNWWREPTWRQTLWLGLLLGLMLLSKFSTAPMFALALLWLLPLGPDKIILNPRQWNWSKAAAAMLLAFFVLWAGYFFHVSHLAVRDGTLTATFPNWTEPIVKPVRGHTNYSLLVPAGEYVEGFRELVRHNRHGQAAFFLGQVSSQGGWKMYYPTAILLKWPTVVLFLSLAGLMLALVRKIRVPVDLWIMSSFPAVYLALAIFARFNIGESHVLPLYPFALLFAAVVWDWAGRTSGRKCARPRFLHCSRCLTQPTLCAMRRDIFPISMCSCPRGKITSLLSDSNLDWGQGLLALREYQLHHPDEQISLSYFGSVDPAIYGIRARSLGEQEHAFRNSDCERNQSLRAVLI